MPSSVFPSFLSTFSLFFQWLKSHRTTAHHGAWDLNIELAICHPDWLVFNPYLVAHFLIIYSSRENGHPYSSIFHLLITKDSPAQHDHKKVDGKPFEVHRVGVEKTSPQKETTKATRKGHTWVFPRIVVPQNGRFIMEIPIKMDDLGVPPFEETPTCCKPWNTCVAKTRGFWPDSWRNPPPVPGNHLHIRWGKGRLTLQMSRV